MDGQTLSFRMVFSVILFITFLFGPVVCVPFQNNQELFATLIEPPPRHIYKSVDPRLQNRCTEKNWQKNQNLCSACGNVPHDFHRDYKIHRKYYPGKILPIVLSLSQVKEGYIEFRICSNGFGSTINHKCFQNNMLFVDESQSSRLYVPAMTGNISTSLIIPPEVPCDRYVLQWKYVLGDGYNGDCKQCETYVGCANIAILDPSVSEDMPKSRRKRQADNTKYERMDVATSFEQVPVSENKFNLSGIADALSTSLGNFLFGSKPEQGINLNQDRTAQTLENAVIEKPSTTVSDFGSIKKVHSVNYLLDSKDIPVSLTNILSNAGDLGTIVTSESSDVWNANTEKNDQPIILFKTHGKPTSIKQFYTEQPSISIPLEVLNSLPNAKSDKKTMINFKTGSETSKGQENKFNIDGLANTLSTSLGRLIYGSSASKLNPNDKVSNQLEIPDPTYHIKPITHSKNIDFSRKESKEVNETSPNPVPKSVNIWHPLKNVFKSAASDALHGLPIGLQNSDKTVLEKDKNFEQLFFTVPAEVLANSGSYVQEKTKNENLYNQHDNRKQLHVDGLVDLSGSKSNTRLFKANTGDSNPFVNQVMKNSNVNIKHLKPTNLSPRKVHQFFDLNQVDSKDASEPLITFVNHKNNGLKKSSSVKQMAAFGVQPRIVKENWRPSRFGGVKENVLFDLPVGFQMANIQTETRPFEATDSSLAIPPEIVVAGSTSTVMATNDANAAALATAAVVTAADGGITDTLSDAASGLKDAVSGTVDNMKDVTGSAADAMSDVVSSASDTVSSVGDVVSDVGSNVAETISRLQDNLPEIVPKSLDAVSDVASSAVDAMSDMSSSAKDTMSDIVSSAADTVSDVASVSDVIPSISDTSVGEVMSDVVSKAGEAVSDLKDALPDSLPDVSPAIGDSSVSEVLSDTASNIGEAVSGLKDALPDSLPDIVPAIGDSSVGEVVSDIASTVGDALPDAVSSVGDSSIGEAVGEAVSGLKDALPDSLPDMVPAVGDSSVGEVVSDVASAVEDVLPDAVSLGGDSSVAEVVGEAVSGLNDALPDGLSDVVPSVEDSSVGEKVSDAASAAVEAVAGLTDALPDGISDVVSDSLPIIVPGDGVVDAAADVVENVVDDAANMADVMGDVTSDVTDVVSDVVDDTKISDIHPPAIVPGASISEIIGAVANAAATSAAFDAVSNVVDDSKLEVRDTDVKETISDIVDGGLKDSISSAADIGEVISDDSILSKAIEAASDIKDNVGDMISDTKDTLSSVIGESPSNAIEKIRDSVSDVVDNVKDLGSDMKDSFGGGSVSDLVDNIKDVGSDMKDSTIAGSVSDMVDNIKDVGSNIKDALDDSSSTSAAILLSGFKPVIGDVSKGKQVSITPKSSAINTNLNLFQIPPSPFEQLQTTRTRNPPIFDDMPPPPPPPSIILKDASSFPDTDESTKESKINILSLNSRKTSPNFIPRFEKDDGNFKLKSKKDDKNLVSLSDSMLYVLAGDYGKYQLGLDKIVDSKPKDFVENVVDKIDDRKLRLPATTQAVTHGTGLDTAATIVAVSEASAIGDSLSDVIEKVTIGDDNVKLLKIPDDINDNSFLGKIKDGVEKIGDFSVAGDMVENAMDKMSDIAGSTRDVMSDVVDTASDISSNIKDGISDIVDSSADAASNVGEVVSDIASNVGDGLSDVASNAGDVVSNIVDAGLDATSNVGDAISDVRSNTKDIVSDVIDKTGDVASNMVDTVSDIRDTAKDVGSTIVDSIKDNSWGKVLSNVGDRMSDIRENTNDAISNVVDAQADAFSNARDTVSNAVDAGKDMISGITDKVADLGGGLDSDRLRKLAIVNSIQNSVQPNILPVTGRNTFDESFLKSAVGDRPGKISTTGVNLVTFFKTGASPSSSVGAGNMMDITGTSNTIAGNNKDILSAQNIAPITSTNMNSNTGQNIGLFEASVGLNSASKKIKDQNTGIFRSGIEGISDSLVLNTGKNIGLFRPGIGLNPDSPLTNTVPVSSKSADSINLWTWSSKQQRDKQISSVGQSNANDRMAFRQVPTSVNLQENKKYNSALEKFLLNGLPKASTIDKSRNVNRAGTRNMFDIKTNLEAISGNVITRSPPPVGKLLDSAVSFRGRNFMGGTSNTLNFKSARGAAFRNRRKSLTVNTQAPVIGVKSRVVGDVISPLQRPGLAEIREIKPNTNSLNNQGNVITGTGNTRSVNKETLNDGSNFPPTNFVSMSRINGEEYSTQINKGPEVLPGRHSPVSMIGVCRLNEDFDCQASGSFSKVPGIDWWCVTNCREGNCKQEQCKCHCTSKSKKTKRVVTADEINRIITLQRETEIRLRNVQLTHRQYKLAANMNCKPTPAYRAVENINKWCNIICAMGKCPTHVCSCPP